MRRLPFILVLEVLVFLEIAAPFGIPDRRTLLIQPLGKEIPNDEMTLVKQALAGFYNLQIRVLPPVDLPEQAFYQPRKRYRAERILTFLLEKLTADGDRILGLTGVDISTEKGNIKDWGIVGLANLGGKECVISTYRCRQSSVERTSAPIILAKVAVHEVGHTLGLGHCSTRGCLMEDAGGMLRACNREFDICPRCRSKLKENGYMLPDQPQIPWPRP
jgi:archaemetzincin